MHTKNVLIRDYKVRKNEMGRVEGEGLKWLRLV